MTQIKSSRDKRYTILALLLLMLVTSVCFGLGRWQLSRAEQRRAIAQEILLGRQQAPIALSAMTPRSQLTAWRPASASGRWAQGWSVLLENRNLNGQPGMWLATPLVLRDAHAVLVVRGWIARPIAAPGGGQPKFVENADLLNMNLREKSDEQLVVGEIADHVPRLFELGSLFKKAPIDSRWQQQISGKVSLDLMPRLQNIELQALTSLTGLSFLPVVLMQTDKIQDGLKREWPEPSQDAEKNIGYALQWFSFAAIALITAVVVAVRAIKRHQQASKDRG